MSAFIVSKAHIDALVTAFLQDGAPASEADEIGRILWLENHRSVKARYGGHFQAPTYRYEPRDVSVVAAIKAIDCYEYQSCEHAGWDASMARGLVHKLRDSLVASVGEPRGSREYSEAPWGID